MTKKAIQARRKYQRELYRRRKELGELPKDRYTPEQRKKYNAKYLKTGKAKEAHEKYWEKKVDE